MKHEPQLVLRNGALIFKHPCQVCGGPASTGTGVSLLRYVRQKEAGKAPDKALLGKWRCFGCEDVK